MNQGKGDRRYDEATIRRAGKCRNCSLDLTSVAHVNGGQFHPEGWRHGLDSTELSDSEAMVGSRRTATRTTLGAISLRSSSHFAAMPYSNKTKPVALPPGRAKLSTKPAPTGSTECANTIGTVRVTDCNAATVGLAVAKMTSGVSETKSVANLRSSAASAAAQRTSIRTF